MNSKNACILGEYSKRTGVEAPKRARSVGIKGVQQRPFTRLARIDPTVRPLAPAARILKECTFRTATRLNRIPNTKANAGEGNIWQGGQQKQVEDGDQRREDEERHGILSLTEHHAHGVTLVVKGFQYSTILLNINISV